MMISGSSHNTKPPSDVTPASLLPKTAMSETLEEFGKTGGAGSCSKVLSPLDLEMTRTRPIKILVIAYLIV